MVLKFHDTLYITNDPLWALQEARYLLHWWGDMLGDRTGGGVQEHVILASVGVVQLTGVAPGGNPGPPLVSGGSDVDILVSTSACRGVPSCFHLRLFLFPFFCCVTNLVIGDLVVDSSPP